MQRRLGPGGFKSTEKRISAKKLSHMLINPDQKDLGGGLLADEVPRRPCARLRGGHAARQDAQNALSAPLLKTSEYLHNSYTLRLLKDLKRMKLVIGPLFIQKAFVVALLGDPPSF